MPACLRPLASLRTDGALPVEHVARLKMKPFPSLLIVISHCESIAYVPIAVLAPCTVMDLGIYAREYPHAHSSYTKLLPLPHFAGFSYL